MVAQMIAAVKREKLIAIVRGVKEQHCADVAQALYDGGIRFMEITYDQTAPDTWVRTADTVGSLAKAFAGKMYIGAGTVTTAKQVELTHRYGGQFIVSPDVNGEVIRRTCQLGMMSVPGALTPTEILEAHRFGAHLVKVFPAGSMGVGYLQAVKAPASHVELLAFGGIDERNIAQYLAAGAAGAGVGRSLVNPAWVEAGEFEKITQAAKKLVALIK